MVVPEERHLLQQWVGREDHPPQPPCPQRFCRPGAGGRHVEVVVRAIELGHVAVTGHQLLDGELRTIVQGLLQLAPVGAEGRATEEMSCEAEVPGSPGIRLVGLPRPIGIGKPLCGLRTLAVGRRFASSTSPSTVTAASAFASPGLLPLALDPLHPWSLVILNLLMTLYPPAFLNLVVPLNLLTPLN